MEFLIESNLYHSQLTRSVKPEHLRHLEENGIVQFLKNDQISFNFVGLIGLDNKLLICLPKFHSEISDVDVLIGKIKTILSVLKKYEGQNVLYKDIDFINTNSETGHGSEFIIADNILYDYIRYGYLSRNVSGETLNGSNEILWEKTIQGIHPVISKRTPVYLDNYTLNVSENINETITELHRWAVNYCQDKYGKLLGFQLTIDIPPKKLSDIGSQNFLNHVLKSELNRTYIDSEIRTLRLIQQLLNLSFDSHRKPLSLYGTRSFHTIWEQICRSILEHDTERLNDLIPKPKWHLDNDHYLTKQSLRPDIVVESEHTMIILDAKYYDFKILTDPLTFEGTPGISDIVKQLVYKSVFANYRISRNIDIVHNIFLFPAIDFGTIFRKIGFVSFNEVFPGDRILLTQVSDEMAMGYYLSNKRIDKLELLQSFAPV